MNFIDKLRQNIFTVGIIVFTLTLLIVFGVEQSDNQNRKRSNVVNEFYSATFKPLFVSDSIDKEEVLNFALEGDLVLDENERRFLQLSKDSMGREVIGISKFTKKGLTDNYAKVIEKIQAMEGKRQEDLDSILELYSKELSKSIYKDKNKVFAVDPQIGMIRKLLTQDLSNFVRDSSSKDNLLNQLIQKREDEAIRDYIVFAEDTVFHGEYKYVVNADNKILNPEKSILIVKEEDKIENLSMNDGSELNFQIDSNFANVTLDNFLDMSEFEDIRFLKTFIDTTADNMKVSFEVSGDSSDNLHLKFSYIDSSNNKIRYEMNSDDIGTALTNSLKIISGKDLDEWVEYGIKMDSLSKENKKKEKRKIEKGR